MKNRCAALCAVLILLCACTDGDIKSSPESADTAVTVSSETIVTKTQEPQTTTASEEKTIIPPFEPDGYDSTKKYSTPYGSFFELQKIYENNAYMMSHPSVVTKELMQRYICDDPADLEKTEQRLKELGDSITEGLETEYDKAYAIAEYVARNTYYDYEASKVNGGLSVMSAEQVLDSGHATCIGYANLVSALCHSQGILCLTLLGGSASDGYTRAQLEEAPVNHTWNAVFCDGEWYFADATWASDNSYKNGREYKDPSYNFTEFYLMFGFHEMNIEHRIDRCELDFVDS